METTKIGKRGTVVIPAALRKRYGFAEGSLVIAEEQEDGVLLRPAVARPVEMYSPERIAEFLIANAMNDEDDQRAKKEVKKLGLNPMNIRRAKPEMKE